MGKRIILTGGGTAGHVSPNVALIPRLQQEGYTIDYIGSYDGIEKTLIAEQNIPYHAISSGKLRRYKSLKNLSDPFRVLRGFFQSLRLIRKLKPDIIFSKGGFVSVPVVIAGKFRKVPTVIHECDMTPGLANRLAMPYARKICTNFEETAEKLPKDKAVYTGTPIREMLKKGTREKGLAFVGFPDDRPVILVTGGSLGAGAVNDAVRAALPKLSETFRIIHLCGKGKLDESLVGTEGYVQLEYAGPEMADLYAAADVIIARAGANTLAEILTLSIPNVLIPLPLSQSRGDQILNAESFEKKGYSKVLDQEKMTTESLVEAVLDTYEAREQYRSVMQQADAADGVSAVMKVILEETK